MKRNKLKINICYTLCILLASASIGFTGCSKKEVNENKTIVSTNKDVNEKENATEIEKEDVNTNTETDKTPEDNTSIDTEVQSKVKFVKHQLDKDVEPKFATEWQDSLNKKISVCIEGRGQDAFEEGIGKIFAKDLSSEEKWSLEIIQGEDQNSPKFLEWIDDENLLVIVGLGYGTISVGGDVYKLNVNTGKTTKVYSGATSKEEVVSIKKVDNKLELEIHFYDDDEFIKSHIEKKIIELK